MRTLESVLDTDRIVMYGAGNQYKYCFGYIREKTGIPIDTVDSNRSKWGMYTPYGDTIESPEKVFCDGKNFNVIITTISNQYEVAEDIHKKYDVDIDRIYMYTSSWYEDKVYNVPMIENHMDDIMGVAERLADDSSRRYYLNSINARLDRQPLYLEPNSNAMYGEYRNRLSISPGDIIVDCGAYTGDTAEFYINKLKGNCFVYAIEPFNLNCEKLKKRVEINKWESLVTIYNCALGKADERRELIFNTDDFGMAINVSNSLGDKHQDLEVKTLDSLFPKENVDYIKMDIEGEENGALRGGKELIRRCLPKMMISAYHRIEDFWEIPNTVWEIDPNYEIYVAHAPGVSTEMEYYCVNSL